jgi:hypothetical protein
MKIALTVIFLLFSPTTYFRVAECAGAFEMLYLIEHCQRFSEHHYILHSSHAEDACAWKSFVSLVEKTYCSTDALDRYNSRNLLWIQELIGRESYIDRDRRHEL